MGLAPWSFGPKGVVLVGENSRWTVSWELLASLVGGADRVDLPVALHGREDGGWMVTVGSASSASAFEFEPGRLEQLIQTRLHPDQQQRTTH